MTSENLSPSVAAQPVRMPTDKRKQSLYFPNTMLAEIAQEAARQDRSLSWILQRSWELTRDEIGSWPASPTG